MLGQRLFEDIGARRSFQYSIGDAIGRDMGVVALALDSFNTSLEMRRVVLLNAFPLSAFSFQHSIGDAYGYEFRWDCEVGATFNTPLEMPDKQIPRGGAGGRHAFNTPLEMRGFLVALPLSR